MVLSVVLGVALVVTLMLSVLLRMPFAVSRYAHRKAESVAEVYRAESALLASLAGFPSGYFDSLPPVSQGELGPWGMWSTPAENGRMTLLVGMSRAKAPWPSYAEWADGAELYRQGLRERIESHARRLSGNRRFFRPEANMEYRIEAGDLTFDADGHVGRAAFYVEGSALFKGKLHVDTLLVYAEGPVTVSGLFNSDWVEIYSGEIVRVEGSATLRGHVWGRLGVTFSGKATASFPSVIFAMGSSISDVLVQDHAKIEGVLAAPNGHMDVESTAQWDSAGALFPIYVQGVPVAFEQKMSR